MDLLHPPLLLDPAKTPQSRIALNRIRHKLHCLLSLLATRPAPQLVLIGRPGTEKITISHQIILIEAAEPERHPARALQSAFNSISESFRFAVQALKRFTGPAQNRNSFAENDSGTRLTEMESSMDARLNEHAITASADLWNFVTAEEGFAEI
jgi:hypothetical protein